MKIERHWCMPSHRTFTIKPFKELIKKELGDKYIDPFPYPFTQDAIEYLKTIPTKSVRYSVFDPPYSQRQLKEMYHNNSITLETIVTKTSHNPSILFDII